ncbi:hypothetical protein F7R91_22725 [Streptomyces luteolifulvus]|uniref:Uncharacterized protein n=1 Tax=Streptomyces luteolifulvus TaxID=2615112 RepID=A0A6H9UXF9_9ACTN|nr:hypothetical protein [Streptomyces luteolifulvus]KAB1144175.1 hypothetical protein F7R91_22725 [Streptomyces luteolifulvus]
MTGNQAGLLPIGGATLASDARVLEAVRAIGARTGVDYTDDAAVSALLREHRRAMDATQRGSLVWLGGLALTVGVIWPFVAIEYVRAVTSAQEAGAQVPELSPVLRKLLDA